MHLFYFICLIYSIKKTFKILFYNTLKDLQNMTQLKKCSQKVSEYDQEMPQSHTAEQPTAP